MRSNNTLLTTTYKPAATVMDEAVDAAISRTGYLAKLMKKRRVQPSTSSESMADEFGRFVLVPISDVDPLAWWKANEPTFPRLSRMARDILAIPGGEVAVERMFSSGRRLISWERCSFFETTVQACECSKSWLQEFP